MAWGLYLHDLHGMPVDAWLATYDPEMPEAEALRCDAGYTGPEGGLVTTTPDPQKAMRFASMVDALYQWRRTSVTHPRRADGLPNRPLSAFTVEPRQLP